jgi:hypothetical protein
MKDEESADWWSSLEDKLAPRTLIQHWSAAKDLLLEEKSPQREAD